MNRISSIRAMAVAVVVLAGAWQPGADAWGAGAPAAGKEEPWYSAWLQVAADSSVDIRKTTPWLRWRTDMQTLYRGDTTGQGLSAFQDGLLPKTASVPEHEWVYDWYSHAVASERTVFSSTTRNLIWARNYATQWVYEFNAPHGIDQVQSGGPFPGDEEISFPGGIKGHFIKQACNRSNHAECVMNPNYREPTGHETMSEIAAVPIDWNRAEFSEGLAWVTPEKSLWAVSSPFIHPVQGADALTHGLRGRNASPPNLRLAIQPEYAVAESTILAFEDYSKAKLWATQEALEGGWVYEVRPNSATVDLSGRITGAREGTFAFIGGIKGGLLMNARRFEKGVSEPVECIGIEKEACRLENRHR
ncbi:scabin-related ADP-ribosyltransferase [Pseudomonas sp. ABY48]|uniref:scabin-related ADP-ribosyltransferase n=1 Tax=Pseudomonas sp. ABY48 TaxID=3402865 RepID=UPI003B43B66B